MEKKLLTALFMAMAFTAFAADHSTGLIFSPDDNAQAKRFFIGLGDPGVSEHFGTELILYRAKDGYAAVWDGNNSMRAGSAFATRIEIDTRVGCENFPGRVYASDLKSAKISEAPDASQTATLMPVEFPAGRCPTKRIKVRILAPTCLSPDPACAKLKPIKSFEVDPGDLHFLDQFNPANPSEVPGFKK